MNITINITGAAPDDVEVTTEDTTARRAEAPSALPAPPAEILAVAAATGAIDVGPAPELAPTIGLAPGATVSAEVTAPVSDVPAGAAPNQPVDVTTEIVAEPEEASYG